MSQKSYDRRRAPRAETLLSVQLESVAYAEDTKTVDASPTGLFVSTRKPMPVGSLVSLRVEGGVTLKARVARVVEADGSMARTPGMGLAIVEGAEHLPALAAAGHAEVTRAPANAAQRAAWAPPVPALKAFAEPGEGRTRDTSAKAPTTAAQRAETTSGETSEHPDEAAAAAESKKNSKKKNKGKGGKRDLFEGK